MGRLARTSAAVAAFSLPLWPSVAGAEYNTGPEQEVRETHRAMVDGHACDIDISVILDNDIATAESTVRGDTFCRNTSTVGIGLRYLTLGGEDQHASADSDGPTQTLQVRHVGRVLESFHTVTWNGEGPDNLAMYTLQPK